MIYKLNIGLNKYLLINKYIIKNRTKSIIKILFNSNMGSTGI